MAYVSLSSKIDGLYDSYKRFEDEARQRENVLTLNDSLLSEISDIAKGKARNENGKRIWRLEDRYDTIRQRVEGSNLNATQMQYVNGLFDAIATDKYAMKVAGREGRNVKAGLDSLSDVIKANEKEHFAKSYDAAFEQENNYVGRNLFINAHKPKSRAAWAWYQLVGLVAAGAVLFGVGYSGGNWYGARETDQKIEELKKEAFEGERRLAETIKKIEDRNQEKREAKNMPDELNKTEAEQKSAVAGVVAQALAVNVPADEKKVDLALAIEPIAAVEPGDVAATEPAKVTQTTRDIYNRLRKYVDGTDRQYDLAAAREGLEALLREWLDVPEEESISKAVDAYAARCFKDYKMATFEAVKYEGWGAAKPKADRDARQARLERIAERYEKKTVFDAKKDLHGVKPAETARAERLQKIAARYGKKPDFDNKVTAYNGTGRNQARLERIAESREPENAWEEFKRNVRGHCGVEDNYWQADIVNNDIPKLFEKVPVAADERGTLEACALYYITKRLEAEQNEGGFRLKDAPKAFGRWLLRNNPAVDVFNDIPEAWRHIDITPDADADETTAAFYGIKPETGDGTTGQEDAWTMVKEAGKAAAETLVIKAGLEAIASQGGRGAAKALTEELTGGLEETGGSDVATKVELILP